MPHRGASGLILLFAVLTAAPANAVVLGAASSLGGYTVRLIGNGYCSGVVIARRIVATAAHCAHGMRVVADGGSLRVIGVSRSAQLDDGRRVSVSGDGAFLHLAESLPYGSPAPIGPGSGDSFTMAGYGTTDERCAVLSVRCTKQSWWRPAPARWSIRLAFCRSVERATALRRAPPRGPLLACSDGVAATKRKVPTNPAWTSLVWRGKIWHGLLGQ